MSQDISWTSIPGSKILVECNNSYADEDLCVSNLIFTPTLDMNGTDVACYIFDNFTNSTTVKRLGRLSGKVSFHKLPKNRFTLKE